MNCKLCGLPNKLIKAHIIPESFFKEASNGEGAQLISSRADVFPKRAPVGVYDEKILCEHCELKFAAIDGYGAKVFISQHDELFSPVLNNNQVVGFSSDKINKENLHKFIASVLWRASVSTHNFYSKVNLGPHTEAVKNIVFNYDENEAKPYTFLLARWVSSPEYEVITKVQLNPEPFKASGVNSYLFYLGKTLAYIKVDQRPFPYPYANLELYAHDDIFVTARNLDKSKELKLMTNVAQSIPEKKRA